MIETDEMIAVELKPSHKLIGNVFLGKRDCNTLELGYVFNRQYWGQGYAAERCSALIRKVFSEGIHRIYAECDPCNEASWKLLERLGFYQRGSFQAECVLLERRRQRSDLERYICIQPSERIGIS